MIYEINEKTELNNFIEGKIKAFYEKDKDGYIKENKFNGDLSRLIYDLREIINTYYSFSVLIKSKTNSDRYDFFKRYNHDIDLIKYNIANLKEKIKLIQKVKQKKIKSKLFRKYSLFDFFELVSFTTFDGISPYTDIYGLLDQLTADYEKCIKLLNYHLKECKRNNNNNLTHADSDINVSSYNLKESKRNNNSTIAHSDINVSSYNLKESKRNNNSTIAHSGINVSSNSLNDNAQDNTSSDNIIKNSDSNNNENYLIKQYNNLIKEFNHFLDDKYIVNTTNATITIESFQRDISLFLSSYLRSNQNLDIDVSELIVLYEKVYRLFLKKYKKLEGNETKLTNEEIKERYGPKAMIDMTNNFIASTMKSDPHIYFSAFYSEEQIEQLLKKQFCLMEPEFIGSIYTALCKKQQSENNDTNLFNRKKFLQNCFINIIIDKLKDNNELDSCQEMFEETKMEIAKKYLNESWLDYKSNQIDNDDNSFKM